MGDSPHSVSSVYQKYYKFIHNLFEKKKFGNKLLCLNLPFFNYKKVKFACAMLLRSDLSLYKHRYFESTVQINVNVLELKRIF